MRNLLLILKLERARKKKDRAKKWVYEYQFGRKPNATVGDFDKRIKDWDDANLTLAEVYPKLYGVEGDIWSLLRDETKKG